ncbi:MAG: hypothetical protein WDA60_14380 [Acidimicrobiia bacterium]|jgi:hypothetical protein
MSWADDFRFDMEPNPMPPLDVLAIDARTAERLLDGQLPPDDAPPEYRTVSALVAALAAAAAQPIPGDEAAVVAAMRRASEGRPRRSTVKRTMRMMTAGALGGVLLLGGLAGAGALPGAAQGVAADALAALGVTVPGPDAANDGHADVRGRSADVETTSEATETPETPDADSGESGHGATISDVARNTDAEGVAKGAEISGLASGGQSQAGVNVPGSTPDTPDPANGGTAGGGSTGEDASGGHSSAGSGNADSGLAHRP